MLQIVAPWKWMCTWTYLQYIYTVECQSLHTLRTKWQILLKMCARLGKVFTHLWQEEKPRKVPKLKQKVAASMPHCRNRQVFCGYSHGVIRGYNIYFSVTFHTCKQIKQIRRQETWAWSVLNSPSCLTVMFATHLRRHLPCFECTPNHMLLYWLFSSKCSINVLSTCKSNASNDCGIHMAAILCTCMQHKYKPGLECTPSPQTVRNCYIFHQNDMVIFIPLHLVFYIFVDNLKK